METKKILMPRELTAENGAKGALIGEFSVKFPMQCPFCRENDNESCDHCNNTGQLFHEVNVPWITIKEIYARAVECFG